MIRKLFIALLMSGLSPLQAHTHAIKLCSSHHSYWMEIVSPQTGSFDGHRIEAAKIIFSTSGIKGPIEIKNMSLKHCLHAVKLGEVDAIISMSKPANRQDYLVYSDFYEQIHSYVFYKKNKHKNFLWREWKDLKGYPIGKLRGFEMGDEFDAAVKTVPLKIIQTNKLSQVIRMASADRIGLFVTTIERYRRVVEKYPKLKGVFAYNANRPINTGRYYLAFSKRSKFIGKVDDINRAIKKARAETPLNEGKMKLNWASEL